LEELEYFGSVPEIAACKFANNKRVANYLFIFEQAGELGIPHS
jgi:hypothetical protein